MENQEGTETKWTYIIPAAFVSALLAFGIYFRQQEEADRSYYFGQGSALACATIYKFDRVTDENGRRGFYYTYLVDTTHYKGVWSGYAFRNCEYDGECIGYQFTLRYALKKPTFRELYLDTPCE